MSSSIAVPASRSLLESLVMDYEIPVRLEPGTGLSLTGDWWTASLEPFGLECTDYGTEAAIIGLTGLVRAELIERLADPRSGDDPRLLMRLWLAERDGQLGLVLDRSARLVGWDYERMCEAEAG